MQAITFSVPDLISASRLFVWESRKALARRLPTSPPARKAWREGFPILMYHRVAPEGSAGMVPWRVHPALFEKQLALLREAGYRAVSFDQVRRWKLDGVPLPERAVMITFDDGYADLMDYAWPLLDRYGFSATVFVVSSEIGGWNRWDSRYGERIPCLGWPDIRAMRAGGIGIGAHTNTHKMLTKLPGRRILEELKAAKDRLEDGLGEQIPSIAYPWGESSPMIRVMARAVGYEYGVTVVPRQACRTDSLLSLPRLDVEGHFTVRDFAGILGLERRVRRTIGAHHRKTVRTA